MTEAHEVEVAHEVDSFVAELRRLADALESGASFRIRVDGEDVTIPQGALLSIAHEREGKDVELEFQVSWTVDAAEVLETD